MSIKLPSSLAISGSVINSDNSPVGALKLRAKITSPDAASIATLQDGGMPVEFTTGSRGEFALTIKDSSVIKQLIQQGYSLLFKSAADDSTDTLDAGLSRSTPLFLGAHQSVVVLLEWTPKQPGDMTKPAIAAKLRIRSVERDGQKQPPGLTLRGQAVGPQDVPLKDVTVKAQWVVPATGQPLTFPPAVAADEPPSVAVTAADGRFELSVARGGDLLPFQPYSQYALRFSVQQARSAGGPPAAEIIAPELSHVSPTESTVVKLRFDQTDPAKPTLCVPCVHRNGKACRPAEGSLEALGQLLDSSGTRPLAGHRVQVKASTSTRVLADVRTNAQGYFSLPHPWPLDTPASDVSMAWKLRVLDPSGVELAADAAAAQDGLVDAAVPLKVTLATAADRSPTIAQLLSELKKTLDPKTQAALTTAKIVTLQDIAQAGGIRLLSGIEKADAATITQLEQAAELLGVVPANVAAADAVKYLVAWQSKGVTSTAAVGTLSRAHGTKALATELGDFRAAQAHHVAAARSNLLNQLLLNLRVQAQNNAGGSTLTTLVTSPLAALGETSCGCEECATTVSPNAYLADLLRYTYYRVGSGGDQPPGFDTNSLQDAFHQPFADLPLDCDSMKAPVLVARIAVEVLRSYASTRPALDPLPAAALASAEASYRQRVYATLLSEIGTTFDELLLAQGDSTKLTELASLLGLPSQTEVEKLLLTDAQLANEDLLESRFGIRKSTRAPLDVLTDSEFQAWRLASLESAWLTQDRPIAFPSGVPILDPDVLAFSNLRLGWDATHATTTRWLNRRTAIDAQLVSLASSRALAVGLGAMSITQSARAPMATADEKWAAYLSVNLSEDEVLSMAATLSLVEQDLARLKAAQKKVLTTRLQRSPASSSTLSADEQNTINAILNYTGTGLSTKVQDESKAWVKALFEGLTPSAGAALSETAWGTNHAALKGSVASPTVAATTADIARFNFSVEVFLRAWDLYLKLQGQGYRAMTAADWQEFDRLFVARWKVGQLSTWASDEAGANITVTPDLFWISADQPAQPRWLGSTERYNQWLTALESASADPIIDPTLIRSTAFTDISSLFPPHAMWIVRDTWRSDTIAALSTRKGQVTAATLPPARVTEFDLKLLNYGLRIPSTDTAAQAWYEPGSLQNAYNTGSMTAAHLGQLLLNRAQFDAIFLVRKLLAADKPVSNATWQAALDALLIAMKRRLHGTWRNEEAAANIALSPTNFQLPTPLPLHFPPRFSEDILPATTLRTATELARWRTVLTSRINEKAALLQSIVDMVDRVEQATLPSLRDALIDAYTPTDANTLEPGNWLTDRLLMDFVDAPEAKTSRVAHAITTLQTLLFSLRTGELFRLSTSSTFALYPVLSFDAEHFDSEWRWMGSYGSWRSALFIFMYPENLLYPTLRNREEQSEPFRNLVQALREGGPVTPERVAQLAKIYDQYFADIIRLEVEAACHVLVSVGSSSLESTPILQSRELILIVAKPFGSGQAYWCYRDASLQSQSPQYPWNPIPGWSQVGRILGAVPFRTRAGRHLVTIIALAPDAHGIIKLQARNLDVANLGNHNWSWVGDVVDLSDIPLPSSPFEFIGSIAVEQVATGNSYYDPAIVSKRPIIYVGLPSGVNKLSVYRRGLNDDATGWQNGTWEAFRISSDFDCDKLLFAYTTRQDEIISDIAFWAGFSFVGHHADDPEGHGRIYDFYAPLSGRQFGPNNNPGRILGLRVLGQHLGGSNQQLLIGGDSLAVWVSYPYIYDLPTNSLFPMGAPTISTISTSPVGILSTQTTWVPFCTESQTAYSNPGLVQSFAVVAKTVTAYGTWPGIESAELDTLSLTLNLLPLARITLRAYRNGDEFLPKKSDHNTYFDAIRSRLNWNDNAGFPYLLDQLYEIHFAVPMHFALQLQQFGYYQYSLDYFRSIFDYTQRELVIDPTWGETRKVYFGLQAEESIEYDDQYTRTMQWLTDPFVPHTVAAIRQRSYTQFTLSMIIRCLLDYADSEFAADTPESIPRARTLYLDALQLLGNPDLPQSQDCEDWVATMDFSYVPTEWLAAAQELQLALLSAASGLPTGTTDSLRTSITSTLKDTTIPKWADRFAKAHKAIRDARAAAPKPKKAKDFVAAERVLRSQAHLALQSLPQVRALGRATGQHAAGRFRTALSRLSGVAADTLDSQASVKFPWLSQPSQKRQKTLDSSRRFPVLAQPDSVIGAGYKRQNRWEPLAAGGTGLAGQVVAAAPSLVLAASDFAAAQYLPSTPVLFCVPINPVLRTLRLRAELNLYKLRTGRNITGEQRTVDFFAAATDAQTGLPALSSNGGLALPGSTRPSPTEYRYPLLVERARRQVQLAAQFESQLLASLEKVDNERRNLLDARNNLAVQRATLNLKNLEVQEANLSVDLVDKQQERIAAVEDYLTALLNADVNEYERAALSLTQDAAVAQILAATVQALAAPVLAYQGQAGAAIGALGGAAASAAGALNSRASYFQQLAGQQRRREEWQQQKKLAGIDGQINTIQRGQATTRVRIKEQETRIVQLNIDNAESVVDFLVTKFTNQELYEWMSRVLQGLYAAQLQQATATARLAQQQLRFDLLQDISLINSDYWTIPVDSVSPNSGSGATEDRRGLTGSARLAKDIEALDQVALTSSQRKLQLTRTISLATLAPAEFQRFLDSGELWFEMREQDFDREFPGHYFRRINKVKVSLLALIPTAFGIRATLANIGPSRVVVPGTAGFETRILPPSNDRVSLTSPINATGLFDLDIQSELRVPFEGVGVDSLWHFELPKPANPIDFSGIADIQITFEYTALFSADYRGELLADPSKLPRTYQAMRVFSFKNELVDAWYTLHNAPLAPADLRASFTVDASDFPGGMRNIRATRLTLYIPILPDADGNTPDLSKDALSKKIGLALGDSAAPAIQFINSDGVVTAQSSADAWLRQVPARTRSPFGTWTLVLPATQAILDLLRADQVRDILFAISYEADLADWPTGIRPKRALF